MGWLARTIVQAKMLWDDVVPENFSEQWITFRSQLKELERVTIPHWIPVFNNNLKLQGFCDASESAFAALIYSRSEDDVGKFNVNFVTELRR